MRYVSYIVAIATLAAVAGCADPYYARLATRRLLRPATATIQQVTATTRRPTTATPSPATHTDRAPGIATTTVFTLGRNVPFLRRKA